MKKILLITSRIPFPPIGGDKLKNYYLINILSKHFKVHLVSISEENIHKGFYKWIEKNNISFKIFKKNNDQLLFISKYNLDGWNKYFFYSTMLDFRTQLAPGYNYKGDSIVGQAISDFFSPAYIQLAFGLEYKPVNYFSITLSPLSGKVTIVTRQYLADAGAFGVEKAIYDPITGNIIQHGKKIRYEFGGRLTLKFKKDLNPLISWDAYLDLFSNYLHNPQNIDVVMNSLLTIKLTKIFTITLLNQMIYDDDIKIIRDWNKDGKYDHSNDIYGPRLQMLSTFGIGLGLKF